MRDIARRENFAGEKNHVARPQRGNRLRGQWQIKTSWRVSGFLQVIILNNNFFVPRHMALNIYRYRQRSNVAGQHFHANRKRGDSTAQASRPDA